jgi:hypothetical protein
MSNPPASQYQGVTYVIPCCGAKLDQVAPARDIYIGSMFRHTLAAAQHEAALNEQDGASARILILSARYGLVELDTLLAPYEQRMDEPGSVGPAVLAAQALTLGIDWGSEVYGLLPGAYFRRLDEALRTLSVWLQDTYEATRGIGDQRGVNRVIACS